jgi:ABC-type glycerol-3-phosphate transport system substrate-binding protein
LIQRLLSLKFYEEEFYRNVTFFLPCAGFDLRSDIPELHKKTDGSGAKLVYWTMWNEAEPQGQVIARTAEAFTKETGIKLDINFNGRDIRMTLQPALDAGEVIDIFDEDIDRVNSVWGTNLALD